MKGITPIIAIIVLLLITVALAGSAWMYMSSYFEGVIGKTGEITTSRCISGNTAMIIIHNIGTNSLEVPADVMVLNSSTGTPVTVNWLNIQGTSTITEIASGGFGVINSSCRETCVFTVIVSGRSMQAVVPC